MSARADGTAHATIERYLDDAQPLDHTNTLAAYDLGQQGDVLVPALTDMLGEGRPAGDTYLLIRLGCSMIRGARIDGANAERVAEAIDAARGTIRPGAREARLVELELRTCRAPSDAPRASDGGASGANAAVGHD